MSLPATVKILLYRLTCLQVIFKSSPMDELGNWCLKKVGKEHEQIQGGIHGNPVSCNPQRFAKFRQPKRSGSCVFCAPLDRYIGRHIDRHIGQVSVDILTDAWPTLGWYIDRDVSVDKLTDISVECQSRYRPISRLLCRLICQPELLSNSRPTCRSIGYWHSTNTSLLLLYWWL